ncbi:hypothetical protein WH52_07920 [Tenacibaculum holothuriorum]|uniref:Mercuric transport protein MerT n=1 Tax=Tenacibaculum holothuriorum TaxID=1635173 RepID=A0A1Y2PBU5_9FLAO|nr:mercuric transporter MerT family protein [Tenacibaculum holothuriorum]OSY87956.1 hypothetical protein WH52_07920 [Tenacibaculum holothuriorum]
MKSLLSSISAVIVAIAACTCCVGPLMALAGMLGVSASNLIWLSSIKNYLILFSLLAIGYNLYRAYYPKKEQECCDVNQYEQLSKLNTTERKTVSFFQSKKFLWFVAVLTIVILLLPYIQ